MFFQKKKPEETELKQLRSFHGKRLSYVSERTPDGELVLGKTGGISITDTDIVLVCDGHEVFRCAIRGAVAAELMSGNGMDIKGLDAAGAKRHVVAYYSRYRG
ncbi:MAG: hypothetical protein QM689_01785 [Oscillospiraceae bacterium]